jgi:hypothetical protein
MTFDESILGTAVMYAYEKELAATKLRRDTRQVLQARPFDEQFIIGSLMYNSGLSFSPERVEQIRSFATAGYLEEVNRLNDGKRARLEVQSVADAGVGYPEQPTSWNAVYHVLQRYGALVALRSFADTFDDAGMFRDAAMAGCKRRP